MSHKVVLTWTAPASGSTVASYDVQRASVTVSAALTGGQAAGPFTSIASVASNATTYTDNGPFVEGDLYAYQVSSVNPAGESSPCPEVTVTIPFSVPASPTGLVATAS